jgi:trehalose utilization protein
MDKRWLTSRSPNSPSPSYRSHVNQIRVTIWNEFVHERTNPVVAKIYPDGIHGTLAMALNKEATLTIATATLDEPEHGLTEKLLSETDVLLWWGHAKHDAVSDEIVSRVHARVNAGMGLVVLHSGHYSKIFKKLMGTTCVFRWREAGERERLWVVNPAHEIAQGLGEFIEIPASEMYGEPFTIPEPEELVFISWFEGGDVLRSGCCWTRGAGRIFYFSPGHELYPIYHQPEIQRVIRNTIYWARPRGAAANVPRNVPIDEAREKIQHKGAQLHDAAGKLV